MIMAKYCVEVGLTFSDYIEVSSEEEAITDVKEACRMNGTWEIFSEEVEEEE